MTAPETPLAEITARAIRLLTDALGAGDTARFLNQYGAGRGDYTAERGALYDHLTLDQAIEQIREYAAGRGAPEEG